MPRSRMVKATYWVEEAVVGCSRDARLLYIGMWNFCDDVGIHPASPLTLKMEVFPGDSCSIDDIKKWVSELINNGLIREYSVNDKLYWLVVEWENRQTINRPTPSHYPLPESGYKQIAYDSTLIEQSVSPHEALSDKSVSDHGDLITNIKERKEREEKEKEEEIVASEAGSHSNQIQNCPQEQIRGLYQNILPMCRQVRIWNKTRASFLRARWNENTNHQSLDFWKWYFEYVRESKFLTGQIDGRDGRPPFLADLEWLVKPNNFAKVIEGKFHG